MDRRGLVEASDRMEQANAVIIQEVPDLAEEFAIMPLSDVFEHADSDDAVEGPRLLPVIAEMETHPIGQTSRSSPLLASRTLLHAKGDPVHPAPQRSAQDRVPCRPSQSRYRERSILAD